MDGIVFFFWGSFAKRKINLIDNSKHLVLKSGHPSPLVLIEVTGLETNILVNVTIIY